jgi:hypothetical protein
MRRNTDEPTSNAESTSSNAESLRAASAEVLAGRRYAPHPHNPLVWDYYQRWRRILRVRHTLKSENCPASNAAHCPPSAAAGTVTPFGITDPAERASVDGAGSVEPDLDTAMPNCFDLEAFRKLSGPRCVLMLHNSDGTPAPAPRACTMQRYSRVNTVRHRRLFICLQLPRHRLSPHLMRRPSWRCQ